MLISFSLQGIIHSISKNDSVTIGIAKVDIPNKQITLIVIPLLIDPLRGFLHLPKIGANGYYFLKGKLEIGI